jgi:hypothetical protein
MSPRTRKHEGREAAQIGTNRGGRAFVDAVPAHTADAISSWQFFDPKHGRAALLAARAKVQFPAIQTNAHEADGRDVVSRLPEGSVVISTVDTVEATRALIDARRADQTVLLQLNGRGSGPTMTAMRLGLSGVVRDPVTQAQASLLFDGLATIATPASSRALTAAGDPMSASLLAPTRAATTQQTVRYFADVLRGSELADAPLTFFTSAGKHPLAVAVDLGEGFSVQKAQALAAVDGISTRRVGIVAAVALVSIEERLIDMLFVSKNRNDKRRVESVVTFRAPAQRFASSAVFTD